MKKLIGIYKEDQEDSFIPSEGINNGVMFKITEEKEYGFVLNKRSVLFGTGVIDAPIAILDDDYKGFYEYE
jgi:hypothetical protein